MIGKVYIASSWKHEHAVKMLTSLLREKDIDVFSFVENGKEQHEGEESSNFEEWVKSEDAQRCFKFDTENASSCDLIIYYGPSGQDAWAEIGIAHGAGKRIIGITAKSEQIGLMRFLVDWCKDINELVTYSQIVLNSRK